MGDANPIHTLGDYSKPSHEGYRNTIELIVGNNVVPLLSDTIRERMRLRLFQFLLRDQASNWLERLPIGSITTWEDLTTLKIFYDRINDALKKTIDYAVEGRLRKLSAEEAWATIRKLAQYKDEGWDEPVDPKEGSLNHENPDIEQLLGVMEYKVDALMKNAISLMGRSKGVFRMTSNKIYQLPPKPSHQEEFEHIVMNFILDQEERVKQLKEYMKVIVGDFMQLSLKVTRRRLVECLRIIESKSKVRNSRNKAVVAKVSSNSSTPGISPDVAALTTEVSELKNMMKTMLIDKQKAQAPAPVKAVEQSCVTCGGAHSYKNCPATEAANELSGTNIKVLFTSSCSQF
ncbi:hypothetical protein Tco_0740590 [Tanacetum coccineum]